MNLLTLINGKIEILNKETTSPDFGSSLAFSGVTPLNQQTHLGLYTIPITVDGTQYKLLLYKYPTTGVSNTGYYTSGAAYDDIGLITPLVTTYKYVNDTWTTQANIIEHKSFVPTIVVENRWYIIAGRTDYSVTKTNFQYIPNIWTSKQPLSIARQGHNGCSLLNRGYVYGGVSDTPSWPTYLDLNQYYTSQDTWTTDTPMPEAVDPNGSFALNNKGYSVSGIDSDGYWVDAVREFNPSTSVWATKSDYPRRQSGRGVSDGDNGYMSHTNYYLQKYTQNTDTWESKAACGEYSFSWIEYGGDLYGCGGTKWVEDHWEDTDIARQYVQSTNTWASKTPMLSAQAGGTGAGLRTVE